MTRFVPYPLFAFALLALWLLLNQSVSPGHVMLGGVLGVVGARVLRRLEMPPLRLRRPLGLLELTGRVLADIFRSNFAVARLVLQIGGPRPRHSGFVMIPLELRNPYGLALLAAIISSTPGTVWVGFNRDKGVLLIHVFDLIDEQAWIRTIKDRYERRLMEIFG